LTTYLEVVISQQKLFNLMS